MTPEEQDELEFLRWFYCHADFGPAHGDCIAYLHEWYTEQTGKQVPNGYKEEE